MRIVAIDPSLTATGVALVCNGSVTTDVLRPSPVWDIPEPGSSRRKPRKRAPQTDEEQIDRVAELDDLIWLWVRNADLLVIEAASMRSLGGLAEERHWLRGLVLARARRNGIPFVKLPPKVVKTYACNSGNAVKEDMIAAANQYFPELEIDDDNEADALWMAALVARRYGVTIDNVPIAHERAMKTVRWPDAREAA